MLNFRGRARRKAVARSLYEAVVARSREPAFYRELGVPDTVDGRFDMVALHAALVLRRLKADRGRSADLAQAFFDVMFVDMDENLRELGVGDLSVGRKVKDMIRAFYGRLAAYEAGLAGTEEELAAALRRNLYRGVAAEEAGLLTMAAYVRRQADALEALEVDRILGGELAFAPIPSLQQVSEGGTHAPVEPA